MHAIEDPKLQWENGDNKTENRDFGEKITSLSGFFFIYLSNLTETYIICILNSFKTVQ